jgi:hypothetical protein
LNRRLKLPRWKRPVALAQVFVENFSSQMVEPEARWCSELWYEVKICENTREQELDGLLINLIWAVHS